MSDRATAIADASVRRSNITAETAAIHTNSAAFLVTQRSYLGGSGATQAEVQAAVSAALTATLPALVADPAEIETAVGNALTTVMPALVSDPTETQTSVETALDNIMTPLFDRSAPILTLMDADSEEFAVDNTTDYSLTVPVGAVGAIIQCKMDSGFETNIIRFTVDGTGPSATNGFELEDNDQVSLGVVPGIPNGDTATLANARFKAEGGVTGRIIANYFIQTLG